MSTTQVQRLVVVGCIGLVPLQGAVALAQTSSSRERLPDSPQTMTRATAPATPPAASANQVVPPPGYVIGPDDVLGIVFWREKDLSAEVVVRPDGIITLPLLEDIKVTGMTPAELKEKVKEAASKLITDPSVTVIVKQINSRKVFITGHVARPGAYPLTAPMTVLQLIALSGGLLEFADRSKIRVMRVDRISGAETHLVNYKQLANGEDLRQNIDLKPGDTVIVP